MDSGLNAKIVEIIARNEGALLEEWVRELTGGGHRGDKEQLRQECREFLSLFRQATAGSNLENVDTREWTEVRNLLSDVSKSRSQQGFSPSETASFVFSFKQPLFNVLRKEFAGKPEQLADAIWQTTRLLDKLGLYTTEVHQKARESIIQRQQEEMLELSTPVIKLWDGVLALPLIGTLDSARTQVVMEILLERLVATESEIAILDITGVPTVDTLTAQHLLKTVAAARLMGAECIISGIRPQIAQTVVQLGVDLSNVVTKATLADAFLIALKRMNQTITRAKSEA